jgi:hypothetical protein
LSQKREELDCLSCGVNSDTAPMVHHLLPDPNKALEDRFMIDPDRRRALILVGLYGAILVGWILFARWAAPSILVNACEGRGSAVISRLVQGSGKTVPVATVLERWSQFSGAVLLAGLIHLSIVLLIRLHDRRTAGRGSSPRRGLTRWANPVLVLMSFAWLACTID